MEDSHVTMPRTGSGALRSLLSFPDPVNEVSARVVAAGVCLMSLAALLLDLRWLTAVIAYGFVARVLTGPALSPLGQLATRVVTPLLPATARPVPGPPKRFAQGIGAVVTVAAASLTVLGLWTAARGLLGLIAVAAFLESSLAFCIGCRIFDLLMRVGLVPAGVCERCNTVRPRRGEAAPTASSG